MCFLELIGRQTDLIVSLWVPVHLDPILHLGGFAPSWWYLLPAWMSENKAICEALHADQIRRMHLSELHY